MFVCIFPIYQMNTTNFSSSFREDGSSIIVIVIIVIIIIVLGCHKEVHVVRKTGCEMLVCLEWCVLLRSQCGCGGGAFVESHQAVGKVASKSYPLEMLLMHVVEETSLPAADA